MDTLAPLSVPSEIEYPESDGVPMGETPLHRRIIYDLIEMHEDWFAKDLLVYVSGNMMLYYEEGNPKKHISPDVQVTMGIPKLPERDIYLVWREGKAPDFMIEVSSKSTLRNDLLGKKNLYRDVLGVKEYFLFDPRAKYQVQALAGFRLDEGKYQPIKPIEGRLPSEVTGLHLECDGERLRLFDPKTGRYLLVPREERQARKIAEAQLQNEEQARKEAEAQRLEESQARKQAEAQRLEAEKAQSRAEIEVERLKAELEALRRQLPRQTGDDS